MQGKINNKKKSTIPIPKKPIPNGRKAIPSKKALIANPLFIGRMVLALTAIFGQAETDRCKVTSREGYKNFHSGTTSHGNSCPVGMNSFTFIVYLRMIRHENTPGYIQDFQSRIVFKYDQIEIRIKGEGTADFYGVEVWKSNEASNPILTGKIAIKNRDKLIWLQVTSTKVILAVRSALNFEFEETNNHECTFGNL